MHYARVEARRTRGSSRIARLAVALYWGLGVMFGLLRLSRADFQGPEVGAVLTAWYVEALLFLAAWGGASCLIGLLSRQSEPRPRPRRRRPSSHDPLRAATLAGLERQRGR